MTAPLHMISELSLAISIHRLGRSWSSYLQQECIAYMTGPMITEKCLVSFVASKSNIMGTEFPHKSLHNQTWLTSPDHGTSNQIDNILVSRRQFRSTQDVSFYCSQRTHKLISPFSVREQITYITRAEGKKNKLLDLECFKHREEISIRNVSAIRQEVPLLKKEVSCQQKGNVLI